MAGTAPVSLCNPPARSSPRTDKAVSQLHVFVTYSEKRISLDYWRDASTQGTPVSLVIVDRRKPSPPGTGPRRFMAGQPASPLPCAVPRRLLPSSLPLLSSGFRKWKTVTNSTLLFCQALRVGSQSQALCLPSENRIGEFARTLLLPSPPTALLRMGQRTPHGCAHAYVRTRKTCLL